MQDHGNKFSIIIFFSLSLLLLTGCSSMMSSATGKLARNLSVSIQNHNDPDTVASAIPAYLIMIDSFIESDPGNSQMLLTGAKLYAAYASIFVNDEQRARKLSQRSLDYAMQASCIEKAALCQAKTMSFDQYQITIKQLNIEKIDLLFALGQSWAVWLKAHSDDWNAIAELPRIRLIVEKVLALDETYQQGSAHLYMGILNSLLPASMGGKPELAKQHFIKAIQLSASKNLMAKVTYAESYARLVFDQPLHDKLLKEVIADDTEYPGMVLTNTLARQKARRLLKSGEDYF